MSKVQFNCHSCGKTLVAEEKLFGATVSCPNCGTRLSVPGLKPKDEQVPQNAPPISTTVLPEPRPTLAVAGFPMLPIATLRDPRERTAWVVLMVLAVPVWLLLALWIVFSLGTVLIFIGIFALLGYLGRLFILAHFKTSAVRVSPQQFPDIYTATVQVCQKLGIEPPDVYVMQNSIWNAFASKLAGRRVVVLLSGAVDSILLKGDMQQLMWVVGHEIGHHAAGHIGVLNGLVMLGGWLPWFALWYRRRAEHTADRIGLYAAGSVAASIKAMCNMTVGAQLADRVDVQEGIKQWDEHAGELFVRYRVLYSTHPANLFRIKRLVESARELGFAA